MLLPLLLLAATATAQQQPCNETQESSIKKCKTSIYSQTNYNPVSIITGNYSTACAKMNEFAQCALGPSNGNCASMRTNQLVFLLNAYCQDPGLKELFSTSKECLATAAQDPLNQPCIQKFDDMQKATVETSGLTRPQICAATQEVLNCIAEGVDKLCGITHVSLVYNVRFRLDHPV